MKNILVTGAGGQLGLTLKELAPRYPDLHFEFKTRAELDVTNKENVEKIFSAFQYDYCINCAAYTHVENAEKEPEQAHEVNAEGVKNLAHACLENNLVLIHISTDYVFDGKKNSPYGTKDIPNPINEYGKSKWLGEQYIQKLLSRFYIVRTSWLYSKTFGKNFYKTILENAIKGEELRVTDTQTGSPTNTISLSNFLIETLILHNADFGIHHFTDNTAMTWFTFAQKIILENGLTDKVKLLRQSNYNSLAKRPEYSVLDVGK
ncbi:MAG: dTDP-4-dehydrorhamnose reductase [Allomuricauda sp.]|nr:MAG: dTDP-4-dehydrorhamnose reductase [Allomuricauda sp.]